MNMIESFPTLIIFTVVSGLYFPIPSLVGVWLNFFGRIVFVIGYNYGAQYRGFGGVITGLVNLMILILSIVSCIFYFTS